MRAALLTICALGSALCACRAPFTPYQEAVDAGPPLPGLEWVSGTNTPMGAVTSMPMTLAVDHNAFYAFGGLPHTDNTTWLFSLDDSTWTPLKITGTPPLGRDGHCAATLASPPQALFIGGTSDSGPASPVTLRLELGIIGALDYVSPATDRPTPGNGCVAMYLQRLGGVVTYGGSSTPDDTWLFNGTAWKQLAPTQTPGGLSDASIVEDPGEVVDGGVSDFLVLFGGETGGVESDATWIFNGDTWAELSTLADPNDENDYEPRPYGRTGAAIAMDPVRRLLYVFGGARQGVYLGDLWRLNLATRQWALLDLTDGPTGRAHASVGYDPVNDRMLIFGGNNDTGMLADGWVLSVTK